MNIDKAHTFKILYSNINHWYIYINETKQKLSNT